MHDSEGRKCVRTLGLKINDILQMEESSNIPSIKVPEREPLVVGHSTFMPFSDCTLTTSDLKKAKRDLGETKEKMETHLLMLKEKLRRDKIYYRMDDDYLLRYLRVKKYDCDKAYKCIKSLYYSRKNYPEVFSIPSNLEYILNARMLTCLPYTDEAKNAIFINKLENWNPDEISGPDNMAAVFLLWDLFTSNPHAQINGVKLLFDAKGFTAKHATEIVRHIKLLSYLLQNLYPWRLTNVIFFNLGTLPRMVLKCITPFINKKMFEKITVLGDDLKELHRNINPTILTEEYGGNIKKNDFNPVEYVLDNINYLKYEHSFGCSLDT